MCNVCVRAFLRTRSSRFFVLCVGPPVNALPDGVLLILVKCFVLIYINGFCASNMLDSNAHNICLNKQKKHFKYSLSQYYGPCACVQIMLLNTNNPQNALIL